METILSTLYSVIYFVIVLGILVFVHEFGHFLMARLSGMRVNTFALGMGFRLFGWNKISGFTFGKLPNEMELGPFCDYRISAFPIGGYCQIEGMVDESFDTEFANKEPQPWEFRAKNPFKKAITISGGVLFNILLAIVFFSIVIFNTGETIYQTTTIGSVSSNSIGSLMHLQSGDKVLSINDVVPQHWTATLQALSVDNLGQNLNIKIERNGKDTMLFTDGKSTTTALANEMPLGLEPEGIRTIVTEVLENGLAKSAGIVKGDTIFSVNEQPITSSQALITTLQAHKNQNVTIGVKNATGSSETHIQLDESGTIGVQITSGFTGKVTTNYYGFFTSIWKGTQQTFETFGLIISSVKQIIVGNLEFKKAIGGPVMIAKQAAASAEYGFFTFLTFTAMLSVSLALINILPFPALDGGHLLIIIIEAVVRKEIPVKIKMKIQQAGMAVLLLLMLYVVYNDIVKIW